MTRIDTSSYWIDSTAMPRFSPLKEDIAVDVLVVGAGMTGVTAAYLAKRAGMTVALVDRGRCGLGETAFTTAHLTCVTDKPLSDLSKTFGRDHAQAAWDAGLAAIDTIDRIAWREQIKCQFEWVPAYLYDHPGEPTDLEEEATLAAGLGFDAQYFDAIPLIGRPGIRYGNQAKFHPRKYLSALVRLVPGKGSYVFENTNVEQIESSRITATTDQGHRVHCGRVMIATHVPLQGMTSTPPAVLLQSKLVPYTTYVVGGWTKRGTVPEALFWETRHAYDYLRVDRRHDHDFVIFGGRDHKTGQVQDTAQRFEAVEQRLKRIVPDVSVTHRWSGQVIDTTDGLPYIGETAEGQFVATGFCGNGITFGTLGAMMFVDKAAGRKNPWEELFDPHRTRLRSVWNYLKQNADYPYYMIRDRFAGAGSRPLREVARGTGQVLEVDGQAAAVYRGLDGKITVRSAVCTHMGCHVQWNNAERTWDCPCHGSRFKPDGEVVAGPAETPLEPVQAVSPKP